MNSKPEMTGKLISKTQLLAKKKIKICFTNK